MRRITRQLLRAISVASIAALSIVTLSSASTANQVSASRKTVSVNDFYFSPKKLHVSKDGKVKWIWRGHERHNVTFTSVPKGASKRSSDTQRSGDFTRSFKKAGTYRYECTIHEFRGRVIVP